MEGKTKVLLADAPTQGHLDRLPVGTLVKVIYATDPWLRRYRGMRAVVGRDDGLSVDVLLSCGHLMSFWRSEVKPLTATTDIWADQGSGSGEPHDLLLEDGAVSGHSLQGQRRRSGLTQAAIARVMGVSVPRISQIEAAPAVRTVTATRYLEALQRARATAA